MGHSPSPVDYSGAAIAPVHLGEKKKKDKVRLVYSDNEMSPEEKMAALSRYAFIRERTDSVILGNAVQATVTGVVDD